VGKVLKKHAAVEDRVLPRPNPATTLCCVENLGDAASLYPVPLNAQHQLLLARILPKKKTKGKTKKT